MSTILAVLVILCLIGIAIGLVTPKGKSLWLISGSILLYLISFTAWWVLLYFQVITLDRVLRLFHLYRIEGALSLLVFLVPPLIPVAIFLLIVTRKP